MTSIPISSNLKKVSSTRSMRPACRSTSSVQLGNPVFWVLVWAMTTGVARLLGFYQPDLENYGGALALGTAIFGIYTDGGRSGAAAGQRHTAGRVISPLLCNVYLTWLDRAWRPGWGRLVRYADDLLVMCRSRGQAQAALAKLTTVLDGLGLEPKPHKTRIVQLVEGQPGFDFLGFHHRLVHSRPRRGTGGFVYLARWPSQRAVQHARDRIRFMTMRARLVAPVDQVVAEVNRFLRGWTGYFRFGNSAWVFDKVNSYTLMRFALFTAKQHQRSRSWGFAQIYRSPVNLGLISLNGIVVAPSLNRPWRAPAEHRR